MRSFVVTVVLLVKLVNSAHIGFSENEKLINVDKSRTKPDYYEKYLGSPKSAFRQSLQLSKNDVYLEKQRKRCDSCRESNRCKNKGKCEFCTRLCKDFDSNILPFPTEAPLVGSIQVYLNNDIPATESSPIEIAPFERSDRFYTIGSFGPGPKQNLLARLMNVPRKDNLEKLVVLAKPKGGESNPQYPVIIDTANVFKAGPELDVEVHSVDGSKIEGLDLDLTSKIDRELDIAIQKKQEITGGSYLSSEEVDKIIDDALSVPRQNELSENFVRFGSRGNAIEPTRITTKRSILKQSQARSSDTSDEELPRRDLDNILTSNQAAGNKLNKEVKREDDYKGENDCAEDVTKAHEDVVGEALSQYEPRPPKYASQVQLDSAPLNIVQERPQAASLESATNNRNVQANIEDVWDGETINTDNKEPEDVTDILLTLAQPSFIDSNEETDEPSNSNVSDPILGKSWVPEAYNPRMRFKSDDLVLNRTELQSSINASHFAQVLQNLEKKVENIADLVKKTCGHLHRVEANTVQEQHNQTNPNEIVALAHNDLTTDQPPQMLTKTIDQLQKGTDSLINSAFNLSDRIQKNKGDPTPDNMQRGLLPSDDNVACSKEDSGEYYVGNAKKVKDNQTVACSKEESEEYVKQALELQPDLQSRLALGEEVSTTPTVQNKSGENVACSKEDSEEYVGASHNAPNNKTIDNSTTIDEKVACSKESDEYLGKKAPAPEAQKKEEVGCSKESDEYVAQPKEGSDITTPRNDETVGCSKEEEEDYLPVYNYGPKYRNSKNKPKSASSTDHKPKLPTLDDLLHPNHRKDAALPHHILPKLDHQPHHGKGASDLQPHHFNEKSQEAPLPKSNKLDLPFSNLGKNADLPSKQNKFDVWDNTEPIPSDQSSFQRPENNEEVRFLPSPEENTFPKRPVKIIPPLHQRFGEQQPAMGKAVGPDGFHMHRPMDLPNWPQLPNRNDVVGAQAPQAEQVQSTLNPFSIFGRVVPQLNNTEVSFQDIPNNKIYFVGTGMNIPLNMKKHDDGSYQLLVDVDKLCSSCKDKSCNKDSADEQNEDAKAPIEEATTNLTETSLNQTVEPQKTNMSSIAEESQLLAREKRSRSKIQEHDVSEISKRSPKRGGSSHSPNSLDLQIGDGTKKDIVKRRVTLVNNVLTWIKNAALRNAHN